jgi:hypothetical protein
LAHIFHEEDRKAKLASELKLSIKVNFPLEKVPKVPYIFIS